MSTWTRHGLSFTSTPSIPPIEHLDVIVLNGSNQNGYFIDLRIALNSPVHLRSASNGEVGEEGGRKGDLDWGFSGTRFEGFRGEGEGGKFLKFGKTTTTTN